MIAIDDLMVDRGGRRIIDRLSLTLAPREVVALVGPSGCGKSTLLEAIAGLIPPAAGRIAIDGNPVAGPGRERMMLFQQDSLFPWLSVRENACFGTRRGDERAAVAQEVDGLLAAVGLEGHAGYKPSQLSGGMRQRAELVRALVQHPRLLLLDEPFAALDAQTREDMQDLLCRILAERGTPAILVTHDVAEAVQLADRVACLSACPARIDGWWTVPTPRPRLPGHRDHPEAHRLIAGIRHALRSSVRVASSPSPI